jgi:hypothetical protein
MQHMHASIGEMRTCGLRDSGGYHTTRGMAQSNERRVACAPRIATSMLEPDLQKMHNNVLRAQHLGWGPGHIRPGTRSIHTIIRVDIHSVPSKTVNKGRIPQFTRRSLSSQASKHLTINHLIVQQARSKKEVPQWAPRAATFAPYQGISPEVGKNK